MTGLLAGRRILVVEDEMLVLMNIEMALEDLGCSAICAAASVAEALSLLAKQGFDAAVVDVNLNGEKSYPIADALSRLGIPFAFSTGYGDLGDRVDLNDRPMLRKPYLRSDLVAVFKQLMAGEPLSS
ncbi:response regulator [Sphingosinicella rhizophila]|uniref:Response regulator n=1 Tax=Sphingosinicella rhizophila TaxID=3050082 RepID=A0ABU3QCD7_9SPHN|nr:response regulator [Sphingosinicella sp. GR2756]MDT9601071.1 response regulator [Sphingosinicella sp. GR2756]